MTKAATKAPRPDMSAFERPKRLCIVAEWLALLPLDDLVKFNAAVEANYQASAIYRWCRQRGAGFVEVTLWRHIKGRCGCPEEKAAV